MKQESKIIGKVICINKWNDWLTLNKVYYLFNDGVTLGGGDFIISDNENFLYPWGMYFKRLSKESFYEFGHNV